MDRGIEITKTDSNAHTIYVYDFRIRETQMFHLTCEDDWTRRHGISKFRSTEGESPSTDFGF